MASTVKFKFKSARDYDTVSFAGTGIKLLDLKRAIVEQKKLHQGMEFDLNIVNDKTKEEYKEDSAIVTKNSSVVVKRVPAPKTGGLLAKMKALDAAAALQSTATSASAAGSGDAGGAGGGGVATGGTVGAASNIGKAGPQTQEDEEAAINALNQQAGSMRHGFSNRKWTADGGVANPSRTMVFGGGRGPGVVGGRGGRGPGGPLPHPGIERGMGPGRPLPATYVCRRCSQPGHHIKDCPTNGDAAYDNARIKRVVGIPTSMIKLADGDHPPQGGVLVNASGQLVTIRANDQAFRRLKEFGGGQSVQGLLDRLSETAPAHLKCPICTKIMSDAVILPCCHQSTCDSCVRRALASSGNMSCPLCRKRGVGPDSLLPNESLRAAVDEYLTRVTRESRGKAGKERAETERLQEDADRLKREEEATTTSTAGVDRGHQAQAAGGAGIVKRKRRSQEGVDAILDLGPRGGDSGDEEEDSPDPFGDDVYNVKAQPRDEGTRVLDEKKEPVAAAAATMAETEKNDDRRGGEGGGIVPRPPHATDQDWRQEHGHGYQGGQGWQGRGEERVGPGFVGDGYGRPQQGPHQHQRPGGNFLEPPFLGRGGGMYPRGPTGSGEDIRRGFPMVPGGMGVGVPRSNGPGGDGGSPGPIGTGSGSLGLMGPGVLHDMGGSGGNMRGGGGNMTEMGPNNVRPGGHPRPSGLSPRNGEPNYPGMRPGQDPRPHGVGMGGGGGIGRGGGGMEHVGDPLRGDIDPRPKRGVGTGDAFGSDIPGHDPPNQRRSPTSGPVRGLPGNGPNWERPMNLGPPMPGNPDALGARGSNKPPFYDGPHGMGSNIPGHGRVSPIGPRGMVGDGVRMGGANRSGGGRGIGHMEPSGRGRVMGPRGDAQSGGGMRGDDMRGLPDNMRGSRGDTTRGPPDNIRGPPDNMRGPPDKMRGPPDNMRGPPDSIRRPPDNMRGPPSNMRGPPDNMRGPPDNMRGPPDNMRGPPDNMRGPPDNMRGPPESMRGPPDNMRGPPENIRGPPENIRGPPENIRGQPENIRGPPDNMRGPPENVRRQLENMRVTGESMRGSGDNMRGPGDNMRGLGENMRAGGSGGGGAQGMPLPSNMKGNDRRGDGRGGSNVGVRPPSGGPRNGPEGMRGDSRGSPGDGAQGNNQIPTGVRGGGIRGGRSPMRPGMDGGPNGMRGDIGGGSGGGNMGAGRSVERGPSGVMGAQPPVSQGMYPRGGGEGSPFGPPGGRGRNGRSPVRQGSEERGPRQGDPGMRMGGPGPRLGQQDAGPGARGLGGPGGNMQVSGGRNGVGGEGPGRQGMNRDVGGMPNREGHSGSAGRPAGADVGQEMRTGPRGSAMFGGGPPGMGQGPPRGPSSEKRGTNGPVGPGFIARDRNINRNFSQERTGGNGGGGSMESGMPGNNRSPQEHGAPMDGRGSRQTNQQPRAPGADIGRVPPVMNRGQLPPPPPPAPSHHHLEQRSPGGHSMERRGPGGVGPANSGGGGVGMDRSSRPPHHMERLVGGGPVGPGGPMGPGGPVLPAAIQRGVGDPSGDRGGGSHQGPMGREGAGFGPGGGMGFGPSSGVPNMNNPPPQDGSVVRGTGGGTLGGLAAGGRGVAGFGSAPSFGPIGLGDPVFGPPDRRGGAPIGMGRGGFAVGGAPPPPHMGLRSGRGGGGPGVGTGAGVGRSPGDQAPSSKSKSKRKTARRQERLQAKREAAAKKGRQGGDGSREATRVGVASTGGPGATLGKAEVGGDEKSGEKERKGGPGDGGASTAARAEPERTSVVVGNAATNLSVTTVVLQTGDNDNNVTRSPAVSGSSGDGQLSARAADCGKLAQGSSKGFDTVEARAADEGQTASRKMEPSSQERAVMQDNNGGSGSGDGNGGSDGVGIKRGSAGVKSGSDVGGDTNAGDGSAEDAGVERKGGSAEVSGRSAGVDDERTVGVRDERGDVPVGSAGTSRGVSGGISTASTGMRSGIVHLSSESANLSGGSVNMNRESANLSGGNAKMSGGGNSGESSYQPHIGGGTRAAAEGATGGGGAGSSENVAPVEADDRSYRGGDWVYQPRPGDSRGAGGTGVDQQRWPPNQPGDFFGGERDREGRGYHPDGRSGGYNRGGSRFGRGGSRGRGGRDWSRPRRDGPGMLDAYGPQPDGGAPPPEAATSFRGGGYEGPQPHHQNQNTQQHQQQRRWNSRERRDGGGQGYPERSTRHDSRHRSSGGSGGHSGSHKRDEEGSRHGRRGRDDRDGGDRRDRSKGGRGDSRDSYRDRERGRGHDRGREGERRGSREGERRGSREGERRGSREGERRGSREGERRGSREGERRGSREVERRGGRGDRSDSRDRNSKQSRSWERHDSRDGDQQRNRHPSPAPRHRGSSKENRDRENPSPSKYKAEGERAHGASDADDGGRERGEASRGRGGDATATSGGAGKGEAKQKKKKKDKDRKEKKEKKDKKKGKKKDRREDRSASPYPNDSGKRKRGRSVEDDGYHRDDVGAGTSRKANASVGKPTAGNTKKGDGADRTPERWTPTVDPVDALLTTTIPASKNKRPRHASSGGGGGAVGASDFYTKRNRPR